MPISVTDASSCHAHTGVAAWHDASTVTHPQQLLVLLLQLAFQVPHSLLNAPVTLFRLQMDHSIDRTKEGTMICVFDRLKGNKEKHWQQHKPKPLPQTERWISIVLSVIGKRKRESWLKQRVTRRKMENEATKRTE